MIWTNAAAFLFRFKREEAKIQVWESHEKAKVEAEMREVEVLWSTRNCSLILVDDL